MWAILKQKRLFVLALLTALLVSCQTRPEAFEEIRGTKAELQRFFTQMPKGGDLHNHLTGSVYAETYFRIALDKALWLDRETYRLYTENDAEKRRIQLVEGMPNFHAIYMECVDNWSARNFEFLQRGVAPDEFFFDSFGVFGTASAGNGPFGGSGMLDYYTVLLTELRARAEAENVSYLEIMLTGPVVNYAAADKTGLNDQFKQAIQNRDEAGFSALLDETYRAWEENGGVQQEIGEYVQFVTEVHEAAQAAVPGVTSYYQGYAGRNGDPLRVFAQLYSSFSACTKSPLLVGVNIVQAENGENSLRDYWGHMRMFRFLKEKMPVKTSMHAGELRLGLVPPEDLKFHISEAIFTAGADRIGHGVDIAFETEAQKTLAYMAANSKAVEINLTSNEFILGVKEGEHPLMLYYKNKVPIILSTDDAGILRTNLTEQYVLAAQRYPRLTYKDLKQIAFNSITYSFLPESEKERLLVDLTGRYAEFEKTYNSMR